MIVWVFVKGQGLLEGYHVGSPTGGSSYRYSVISACPFTDAQSNRGDNDLVLLFPDHSLHLWNGHTQLVPVSLVVEGMENESRPKRSHSQTDESFLIPKHGAMRSKRVVELAAGHDPNQFVLVYSDGTMGLARTHQTPLPILVQKCLYALQYVVDPLASETQNPYTLFLSRFDFARLEYSALYAASSWELFVMTLFSFLHTRQVSAKLIKAKHSPLSVPKDLMDDWTWVQNYRRRRYNQAFEQTPPKSRLDQLHESSKRLHLQFHTDPNLIEVCPSIVTALHYVYQDIVLDATLQGDCEDLGALVYYLAGETPLGGYYKARHPVAGTIAPPVCTNLSTAGFPDIMAWALRCITAQRAIEGFYDGLQCIGMMDPSKFQGLQTLRQVTTLYTTLFSEGPHKMVQTMTENLHSMISLDLLPLGVGLCLRQALNACRDHPGDLAASKEACRLIGRRDLAALADELPFGSFRLLKTDREEIQTLRFFQDDRIEQVKELLMPTIDAVLPASLNPSMSIEEIGAVQQSALATWSGRPFALPLGKALLNFEASDVVPTEAFPIPKINRSARLPPLNSLIEYGIQACPEVIEWPEFHMGVASALEIKQDCKDVTSSWIVFNQAKGAEGNVLDAAHAGFIFGLGLQGHLKKLDSADSLRSYFLPQFDVLSVGHLLGLAAAHIGSRSSQITSMLIVHIPSMLPSHSVELAAGSILKTAAMIGYGLIHFEHPSQYKFDKVLAEIETVRIGENAPENSGNESYAIGCGFALGFIGLASGGRAESKATAKLVDKLLSMLSHHTTFTFAMGITAALGLICMKSNNRSIARHLAIPASEFALDSVTPELVLIQTVCRQLVLWRDIGDSVDWVHRQLPEYMLKTGKKYQSATVPVDDHVLQCYFAATAGLCFAMALKFASTCNKDVLATLLHFFNMLMSAVHAKGKMLLNPLMTALALLMAGSGDIHILNLIKTIQTQTGPEISYGSHMAASMSLGLLFLSTGSNTIGTSNRSIAALFGSLYPIYPLSSTDNRSHLQALRHLWVLAVERRCFLARDVDTGLAVKVPVQIECELGTVEDFAPLLLPEFHQIKSITVRGPRYWELSFPFLPGRTAPRSGCTTVWVQRKTRYLSYTE
ncbi:Anaphase-promoting complex subunit 1, partial [Kappamyces sp. JEL0680]